MAKRTPRRPSGLRAELGQLSRRMATLENTVHELLYRTDRGPRDWPDSPRLVALEQAAAGLKACVEQLQTLAR